MRHFFIALFFIGFNSALHSQVQQTPEQVQEEKFKLTHGPYLQSLNENSVTIVWTTNRAGIAWVEIAPDDSSHFYEVERKKIFSASNGLKNVSTVHTVRINNLQPSKNYRYRVYTQEVLSHKSINVRYGDVVATNVYTKKPLKFKTNDYKKKEISFLVLNDIHERNEVLKKLLEGTDWNSTDLVLFNGDMVSFSRNEQQVLGGFMDTATQIFASETPMYYARGNHETRGEFAAAFPQYFPGPEGKLYYVFRQGPVCFIVLDSGEDKPDSDIEYAGITAFDEYRDEQAAWLKSIIHSKIVADAPYKIAVAHIPPFGSWHGEGEIDKKFVPLLNEAGIDVMLCAHLHRSLRKNGEPGSHKFPVVVNSNNSILKVKANDKELKIATVDISGKVTDSFAIPKR